MHDDHRAVQRKLAAIHAEAHELRVRQMASLDMFFAKQSLRIAVDLARQKVTKLDPGGTYSLEVKGGSHPHTVQLTETPQELLKKEGEAGYRRYGSLSTVPGS